MHMVHKIILHIGFQFDQLAPFRSVIPSSLRVSPSNLWFILYAGSNFYFWWCFGTFVTLVASWVIFHLFWWEQLFLSSGDLCCACSRIDWLLSERYTFTVLLIGIIVWPIHNFRLSLGVCDVLSWRGVSPLKCLRQPRSTARSANLGYEISSNTEQYFSFLCLQSSAAWPPARGTAACTKPLLLIA